MSMTFSVRVHMKYPPQHLIPLPLGGAHLANGNGSRVITETRRVALVQLGSAHGGGLHDAWNGHRE